MAQVTAGDDVAESLRLVSAVLAALRDNDDGLPPIVRVCRACVALLPVDGAAISIIASSGHRQSLYASDAVAAHLETVQFSLGEGPCFEAFDTGEPVLVPDLAQDAAVAWPVFAAQMNPADVGAIFAIPLRRGTARVGAIDMYRRTPGWLLDAELSTALKIADIATSALLTASNTGADGEIDEMWLTTLPGDRAVVHQATGIVIAEFGIPAEQALARLRGYAFVTDRLLDEVAGDLVAKRLHPRVIDR
ncbi:ANTAR domain-containing protein [Prauserella marina]|uniref:ANTAR domain-containing protein n=1 Tax=Prauserella marina TaxID=530584 RepID=A0A1G6W842_9PSEU|nr:GAF domain-containing protein [Prauserella marina]SDD61863.1 ANTAR domain-containing protein [Prauserella marina]